MASDVIADLVGKCVELGWVEGMVGTGIFNGSSGECCNFSSGWINIVLSKVLFDSGGELGFVNLTVMVGIDMIEDILGFSSWDRTGWTRFDFDGRGGGDEGDKGEFHFDLVLFFIIIWFYHGL